MDGVSNALTIVAGVLAILVAIGAGLALIRGSYSKARIEALRGDNQDLRDRVNDLESADERSKLRESALEQRCSHLEDENKTLMKMVTQRAEVSEVMEQLVDHHRESMEAWVLISSAIERLASK